MPKLDGLLFGQCLKSTVQAEGFIQADIQLLKEAGEEQKQKRKNGRQQRKNIQHPSQKRMVKSPYL